jgi:hypothetical protein
MRPFWEALYEADVEVVLSGHAHHYERFAPQTPSGQADPVQGIREFVVGTGGYSLNSFKSVQANSEKRISDSYGVIKLVRLAVRDGPRRDGRRLGQGKLPW